MDDDTIGQGDEVITVLPASTSSNLRPFRRGDGRASEMGKRGVAVREAKRAMARADADGVAAHLARLMASHRREDLGPAAAAAALDMIGRVSRGEQAVKDPADWVRVLVDVARLEAGESTSNAVVAHVGAAGAAAVIAVRDRARAALAAAPSSSASTVDDPSLGGDDDGAAS